MKASKPKIVIFMFCNLFYRFLLPATFFRYLFCCFICHNCIQNKPQWTQNIVQLLQQAFHPIRKNLPPYKMHDKQGIVDVGAAFLSEPANHPNNIIRSFFQEPLNFPNLMVVWKTGRSGNPSKIKP